MRLQQGQVVRYGEALWRVDYVNECRARITPLSKRHVVIKDVEGEEERSFDAERAGVNISPNSELEVITDLERARDQIELVKAEEELREVRRALVAAERREVAPQAPPPAGPAAPRRPASLGVLPGKAGGWRVSPKAPPPFRAGSLAAVVMAHIQAHPGLDTKELVAAVLVEGNVGACVSRFFQAGLIERS